MGIALKKERKHGKMGAALGLSGKTTTTKSKEANRR
jgi:hypothetical protein